MYLHDLNLNQNTVVGRAVSFVLVVGVMTIIFFTCMLGLAIGVLVGRG